MTFNDTINYILFSNPLVKTTTDCVKFVTTATLSTFVSNGNKTPAPKVCDLPVWKHANSGGSLVRIAGLFGATAVVLGAYGAHAVYPAEKDEELKKIFETANKYHFLHSVALLGVPLCRWPKTSGSFLIMGMLLFCGTCYYHALTGRNELRRLTPVGGTFLIAGWLAMVL